MMNYKSLILSACLALTFAATSGVNAQTQQQQQTPKFDRYGPFFFFPEKPEMLIYTGQVGANDLLNLKKALRENPTISTLILSDNPGGLVHIGLVIAEEVYERGLNTYIPPESYCASACSFVFFAGKNRVADGRLGVHQISAPELSGEQAQFGVSDIVATLPKYGVSADVLGIMFSTPAKDMYYFTPQEVVKYGINRTGETRIAATQPANPGSGHGAAPSQNSPSQAPQEASRPRDVSTPPNQQDSKPGAKPAISDEEKAMNVATLMIQTGSANNDDAMAFVNEYYADTVDYFKKRRAKDEILQDKNSYFNRWPVRRFVVDESSLRAKCDKGICAVYGLYDYTVSSPDRNKKASGTSNFTYVLDLANGYRIIHEDSEVVQR